MPIVTDSVIEDILLVLVSVLYLAYWWYTNNNDYWDKRNVPNVKIGLFLGSLTGKKTQSQTATEIYQKFPEERFVGFFQFKQPVLMIREPQLINKVMVKDFVYFQDRGVPTVKHDPLSSSLFTLRGQVWRALRYRLTPTFSTGKLKGMFEQLSKCGDHMAKKIEELSKENTAVETKMFLFEFTMDVISSCAFGLQFKPDSLEFLKFKSIVQKMFTVTPIAILRFSTIVLMPKVAAVFNIRRFGNEIGDYFTNLTKTTLKYRKDNNIQRNDYFQMLLTLKEQEESGKDMGLTTPDTSEDDAVVNQMQYTEEKDQRLSSNTKLFTDDVICANSFVFLLAGSESTSSTITFILFELSRHPDIQERLQQEVDSMLAKHGGWSYEAVKEMTYLDQVVQEGQRLYPVLVLLLRECVKPYKVPESDLVIEKGVLIGIPVSALHKDPQYYPDPELFKPERFKDNHFKPSPTYLPYGDGPRICIAMRFAIMEVKTCIARIMSQYSVRLSPKTQLPVQFVARSFTPLAKGGMWLSFEKRITHS